MPASSVRELVDFLQEKSLRLRTGIWLLPPRLLGNAANEAARLNVDSIDIRDSLLASLPEGTRFLGLTADRILELLQEVSEQFSDTECIHIFNLDLLLAKLPEEQRDAVWQSLYSAFPHRRHALLISMPEGASHLLPTGSAWQAWISDKRLASGNQN